MPQGKIKFQTERVRDRQRQRKNDREIEIESWNKLIYFGLKLVQKYDENLHKCGIVVRLISTFLSTRKCTCRQRENECEIFSEIFIGTFNFSNCAFFILGSFLNLSLGIFTNDELTRTETERSCGRNCSSTSSIYNLFDHMLQQKYFPSSL